ncbi:LOW QUALITY PROTEIN: reticulon-like protein B21 [Sesamum indicum]|uniref:Reticulon-like protein n=1 Tax=Sesamum indicum TaxID=4182 RepID=A0A6I9T5X6_SESIN|nr:LOW QUALITY PROTEIN: reticulon-like protein B21 [Sesamum indicum]
MSTKEAVDLGGSRRRGSAPKAGSVWESRMKLDEVKGGIKVFIATHENPQEEDAVENMAEVEKKESNSLRPKQSPIGIGVSGKRKTWKSEGSEGSPVQIARQRSEVSKSLDEQSKELSVSGDGIKRSPLSIKKTRSVSSAQINDGVRKVKSDSTEVKNEGNSELRKVKSEALHLAKPKTVVDYVDEKVVDDEPNREESSAGKVDKSSVDVPKSRSDVECVCEEKKAITSTCLDDNFVDVDGDEEEQEDKEIEVENKSLDIKAITEQIQKPKRILVEEKKLLKNSEKKSVPFSPVVRKKTPPAVNHVRFHPTPTKTNNPTSDHSHGIPRTRSKLQSFVDLVMWRDVSKSAFVFGIGTFAIISSSYTKDLNVSFISVVSYLGLVYLAAIFLFRSLISRGAMEMDSGNEEYVVGEEELRALFSGDPATTMKLAVLLFILARCGSSITIWKMAKLGFIGVFTVPKFCSSYSSQLTAYGTFWIRRFRDAWGSCSHKKAVGFAVFALVWNLSSVVARIWAVFMLFVGFKYYQQSLVRDADEGATNSTGNHSWQGRNNVGSKQKKVC